MGFEKLAGVQHPGITLLGHGLRSDFNILADLQLPLAAQQDYVFVLEAFHTTDPQSAEGERCEHDCTEADNQYGATPAKPGKPPANSKINAIDNARCDSERGKQPDQAENIAH
jgi:hypothetical protein